MLSVRNIAIYKTTGFPKSLAHRYTFEPKDAEQRAQEAPFEGIPTVYDRLKNHLPIIPEDMLEPFLKDVLTDMYVGGATQMWNYLKTKFSITRRAVQAAYLKDTEYQAHRAPKTRGSFQPVLGTSPMEHIQMDAFHYIIDKKAEADAKPAGRPKLTPRQKAMTPAERKAEREAEKAETRYSNTKLHILTIVDTFSKFLILKSIGTSKTAESVKDCFKEAVAELPKRARKSMSIVQSDNGSEFKNSEMTQAIDSLDLKQVFSQQYKPTTQGKVENMNGIVKRLIKRFCQRHPDFEFNTFSAQTLLDNICRVWNDSVNNITKFKPNELIVLKDKQVIQDLYNEMRTTQKIDPKLEVGTYVRVSITSIDKEERKKRTKVDYDPLGAENWSEEVYRIKKVLMPRGTWDAPKYVLNKSIEGKRTFLERELLTAHRGDEEEPEEEGQESDLDDLV